MASAPACGTPIYPHSDCHKNTIQNIAKIARKKGGPQVTQAFSWYCVDSASQASFPAVESALETCARRFDKVRVLVGSVKRKSPRQLHVFAVTVFRITPGHLAYTIWTAPSTEFVAQTWLATTPICYEPLQHFQLRYRNLHVASPLGCAGLEIEPKLPLSGRVSPAERCIIPPKYCWRQNC